MTEFGNWIDISDHKHHWKTRYISVNNVNIVSGMYCDCGDILSQDEVEKLINDKAIRYSWINLHDSSSS